MGLKEKIIGKNNKKLEINWINQQKTICVCDKSSKPIY
jgi:hypothetical protein